MKNFDATIRKAAEKYAKNLWFNDNDEISLNDMYKEYEFVNTVRDFISGARHYLGLSNDIYIIADEVETIDGKFIGLILKFELTEYITFIDSDKIQYRIKQNEIQHCNYLTEEEKIKIRNYIHEYWTNKHKELSE